MKISTFLLLVSVLTSITQLKAQPRDFTKLVNPFVGTVGSGNTFTGPVLPYGMVQLGPYLTYSSDHKSGTIYGFSHTHLSGMAGGGNGVAGDIIFMPLHDDIHLNSKFQTVNEKAQPGYYQVLLDDNPIDVELTATTRVGLHKYTFQKSDHADILLKLENG